MENDLKVLVVDDTVTYRKIMSDILTGIPNVELVGTAANGKIALNKIEMLHPDLVFLDVDMPEMDGLETLDRLRGSRKEIDVVMVSGTDQKNAELTMKALSAGALDFIPKPRKDTFEESLTELKSAISRLIPIARTRKYSRQIKDISAKKTGAAVVVKTSPKKTETVPKLIVKKTVPQKKTRKRPKPGRIDVVAIGVSTGGPNALQKIIPFLKPDFPAPILAVQHMPPTFTMSLAERLNNTSPITVVEGKEGQLIEKGIMYLAPGGRHMVVKKDSSNRKVIGLTDSPPVNSCRPAVDVLFFSIATLYGGNVLTVILTGMGSDGRTGVTSIRENGGYSLVQDEHSSVIWGMPGAVVQAEAYDEIVSLENMANKINRLVTGEDI